MQWYTLVRVLDRRACEARLRGCLTGSASAGLCGACEPVGPGVSGSRVGAPAYRHGEMRGHDTAPTVTPGPQTVGAAYRHGEMRGHVGIRGHVTARCADTARYADTAGAGIPGGPGHGRAAF